MAEWYAERGYTVLARNWRCPSGELDLVVRRGRTVVFCEVKTRSSTAFGAPVEAVTPVKQARLRRLAGCWLEAAGRPASVSDLRFDVASVLAGHIEVIEGAF
ncbi:MAG: YraN family protein [Actinomycetota bacterium]|nr:YraN family protein [Actinomycetota bacterium]